MQVNPDSGERGSKIEHVTIELGPSETAEAKKKTKTKQRSAA
jgi:hypothetical protein